MQKIYLNETTREKYAYPIKNVYRINNPMKLDYLRKKFSFTAPQSFAYGEKYKKLIEYIEKSGTTKLY